MRVLELFVLCWSAAGGVVLALTERQEFQFVEKRHYGARWRASRKQLFASTPAAQRAEDLTRRRG